MLNMTDYPYALPTRPLALRRTGIIPGIFSYLGGLLLLAVFVFLCIWQGPGIVRDIIISRDPVIAQDADVRNGECESNRLIFVECSADIAYEVKGKHNEASIDLMFVDFHNGDYASEVVYSASSPRLATLQLGIDMLWNRIIFGAVLAGVAGIFSIGLFAQGARADIARLLARRTLVQTPVEVEITQTSTYMGGVRVQYTVPRPGKKQPLTLHSQFKKTEAPFMLASASNKALALLPQGSKVPILLDDALDRIDLTAAERMTLLTARRKAVAATAKHA